MNQYLNFNISTDKELVFKNPSEIENIYFLHFSGNLKPWTIEDHLMFFLSIIIFTIEAFTNQIII